MEPLIGKQRRQLIMSSSDIDNDRHVGDDKLFRDSSVVSKLDTVSPTISPPKCLDIELSGSLPVSCCPQPLIANDSGNDNNDTNHDNDHDDENEASTELLGKSADVDGRYAWFILFCVFILNTTTLGALKVYGLIFERIVRLNYYNREDASWPIATASTIQNFAGKFRCILVVIICVVYLCYLCIYCQLQLVSHIMLL